MAANEAEEFEFRARAEREAKSRPANYYRRMSSTPQVDPMEGIGTGQRLLEGMGKGFTDIGRGVSQMVGMGPSRAEVERQREQDLPLMATPAGFMGNLGSGVAATLPLAAIPGANTIPGTMVAGGLYGASNPVGEGESRAMNTVVGAGTAGATKVGMDALARGLSSAVQAKNTAAIPGNARQAELARVLEDARGAGFQVPPAQANPSAVNRVLESIGGKAATKQQASVANQDVAYGMAQRHAGLPPTQAITEQSLKAAREAAAAPYKQVAQQSPEAAAALEAWKQANFEMRMQNTFYQKSGNPDAYKAAQAARQAADEALNTIEQVAGEAAKPALQAARVQIAKIHTIDDAMKGASFDPAALVRSGAPVQGEMRVLSDFAQNFPKAMERPQLQGSPGVNQLLPYAGGAAGGAMGGAVGGPAGAAIGSALGVGASQAVPPAVRSLILSPTFQRLMTTPPQAGASTSQRLAAALMNNPELQAVLPALAGGAAASQ